MLDLLYTTNVILMHIQGYSDNHTLKNPLNVLEFDESYGEVKNAGVKGGGVYNIQVR